jgi:hypothetical protein
MRRAKKTILLPTKEGRGKAPRVGGLEGRATSDDSQKHSRATHAKSRSRAAKSQRRYRLRHPERHAAQQRAYRRRKREDQERDEGARSVREHQEARERAAAANKVMCEVEARICAAEGLAKAAGVPIERWLDSEEASKYADLRERLIARERLCKEVAEVWEELGYDPLTGNPVPQRKSKPEPVQEQRALTLEEACTARRNAAYAERMRGLDELKNLVLSNGMILG